MNFAQVKQSLNHVKTSLYPILQMENMQVSEIDKCISWSNRVSGIYKNVYYPVEYQNLVDKHQYSLILTDGSFFQFYYKFDENGSLSSGRLSFYPSPSLTNDLASDLYEAAEAAIDREDDPLYEHLYNWAELVEIRNGSPSNTSHVRFDYDSRPTTRHAPAHLQFGGINELRLDSNFFPLPLSFVRFVSNTFINPIEFDNAHTSHSRNHRLLLEQAEFNICLSYIDC